MGIIELGLDVAAEKAGAGRHMHYLPLPEAEQALKWINVSEFLTLLALCLVKVSVVLFLLRIGNLKRWLRTALVVNMAILVLSTTALLIVLLVQCRPIQANWDLAVKATATCISMDSLVDISYLTTGMVITCLCTDLLLIENRWQRYRSLRTPYALFFHSQSFGTLRCPKRPKSQS